MCQNQRHGSVLMQVWVPKGSGRSLPRAPTRLPLPQLLGQHLDPVGPWAPQPYQENQLIISRHKVVSLTATEHSSYASSWAVPTHGQLVQHHTLGHGRGTSVAFISHSDLLWLLHRVPGHPNLGAPAHHPKKGLPSGFGAAVGAQSSAQGREN